VTLNNVIIAIAQALYSNFGDSYTIYTDEIKQDISLPCFYIKIVQPFQVQGLYDIKKRFNKFDIHFFPEESNHKNKDLSYVYDELVEILEYINIENNIYRGTNMQSHIQDGILHFFVNYDFFVKPIYYKYYMQKLIQKGSAKNG